MKLLLDECLPRKLKREFTGHEVLTADEAGFKGLKNGKLIQSASEAEFEVLVSADKNIEHQQNKMNLPLAILILAALKQSPRIAFTFNGTGARNFNSYQNRRNYYNRKLKRG